VVVVPIYRKDEERTTVLEVASKIAKELGAKLDDREGHTPGAKFFHWERRGIPVVVEIGPRDVANGTAVMKRRDTGLKEISALDSLGENVADRLDKIQTSLYDAAKGRLKANTIVADTMNEVEDALRSATAEKGGGLFVMAHMKDDPACDARVKQFKATIRCIPLVDEYDGPGKCLVTGEQVDRRVVIAKAY